MKNEIVRKLTSRKLWVALADFVGMLLVALNVAEETAAQVAAILMAGAGVLGYLLAEGLADSAGANAPMINLHPPEGEQETDHK